MSFWFKRIGTPILLGFLFLGGYLTLHLGAFKSVTIEIAELPEMPILYKHHTGPYHKIAPVIQEVEAWAQQNKIACPQTFGEYLDDPRSVDEDRLNSNGGCIIAETPASIPIGFSLRTLNRGRYVRARFDGSPAIGPMKVYPKIEAFLSEQHLAHGGTVIEVYTVKPDNQMSTEYLVPAIGEKSLPFGN